MSKNTLVVMMADMHSGSNYALFPDHPYDLQKGNNHHATSLQQRIRQHFETTSERIAEDRKDKRVILVHNGDALDGFHHDNTDIATRQATEQMEIHQELMVEFQRRINWQAGDQLYYTVGTECHTGDNENIVAEKLNAVQTLDGMYVFQNLQLEINNFLTMFVHHGPNGGFGKNEGNALRSWLENIYIDYGKNRQPVPDLVVSGHVHTATFNDCIMREDDRYRRISGVILPSWQAKTRFAHRVSPVARNRVGTATIEIGDMMGTPTFYLMNTESTIPMRA
ncbi:MAG: hypothetical protein WC765_07185 [Phycisphaerae bacterium]|jgi:hypothetical protein